MKVKIFLFVLLFLMINSCAKEDPDEKNKSFEEKITGTFNKTINFTAMVLLIARIIREFCFG